MLRKHLPLLIGIAIPVLMVLLVAASIIIPGMLVQPQYGFLYLTTSDYSSNWEYSVEKGQLTKKKARTPGDTGSEPTLYLHDITTNTSRAVTFEEAQKLKLDPVQISPDGFEVVQGQSGDFLFFGGSHYPGSYYIRGHGVSKRLPLKTEGRYYYGGYQFLGWILPS